MATRSPVLIVGAGLAGLSCAHHLRRPWRLVERAAEPGGLARSSVIDGFGFDHAGHWLHLRDPALRSLLFQLLAGAGGWLEVERRAIVCTRGVRVPYPFQANTHGLPPEVVRDCVLGFFEAGARAPDGASEPVGFEDFILHHLGAGFAQHFMVPYNRKLWGVPLADLSAAWCGRFVPRPSAAEVVSGAVGLRVEGLGYNAHFLYPARGGMQALPRAWARSLPRPLELGVQAVALDLPGRRLRTNTGEWIPYEHLVSSLPLPALLDLVEGALPDAVRRARAALRATDVRVVHLGVEGPALWGAHWAYVPDPLHAFYRVGCYSNAVPALAPPGCSSLYVELSRPFAAEHHALHGGDPMAAVERGLRELGAIGADAHVRVRQILDLPSAYVLFDHAHAEAVPCLLQHLRAEGGIHSIGRYGRWTYGGMEDAMLDGRRTAQRIDSGSDA